VDGLRFLVPELPTGVCPWVFPLFFDERHGACRTLRGQGIPTVTGVRRVGFPTEAFPESEADYLYSDLVFLPVHQNPESYGQRFRKDSAGGQANPADLELSECSTFHVLSRNVKRMQRKRGLEAVLTRASWLARH